MRAAVLSCSLKRSSDTSNTQLLADVVIDALREAHGVESQIFRLADLIVLPGVESDMGDGDAWPIVRGALITSEILIVATPTWVGRPSSFAQLALERIDAMISETDDHERPVAYNRSPVASSPATKTAPTT